MFYGEEVLRAIKPRLADELEASGEMPSRDLSSLELPAA